MAIMIPSDGGYFDPASGEKEMFEALQRNLPDDYYVFHSYRLVQLIPDRGLNENEIDFLIFHPEHGCLFVECKNSKVERDLNGDWHYIKTENGNIKRIPMKDPFDQAFTGQHNLFNKLKENYPDFKDKLDKCKFLVAVWLPKYFKTEIADANFGPNVVKDIILTREALLYKDETIKQIEALMERMKKVHLVCKFEEVKIIENASGYDHSLSHDDSMLLFKRVLCPTFRSIVNLKKDYETTYLELLEEQYVILDFLTHQRTAAISGASGTGKTLVAIERARRLSEKNEKVLFLCYNHNLMESLKRQNESELKNVDFYTLDSFACKKCNATLESMSYYDLYDILETEMKARRFEYKHIVVDEGQDFGKREETDSDIKSEILELLSDYGSGAFDDADTSFFVFYDKNQLVNTKQLPVYLQNVDSKLTLYKNCRNTKKIASTAYSLIDSPPIVFERAWDGEVPDFIFYNNKDEIKKRLDNIIENLSKEAGSDRVIISCSPSIKFSSIYDNLIQAPDGRNWIYKSNGKKTKVFTCPTFKGLEAEDVIIIDVGEKAFEKDNCDFYVAASRAKKHLFIFIDKEKTDVEKVIQSRFPNSFPLPDKDRHLAIAMHGNLK